MYTKTNNTIYLISEANRHNIIYKVSHEDLPIAISPEIINIS